MEVKPTNGTHKGGAKPGQRFGGKVVGTPNRNTRELWRDLQDLGMGTTFDNPVVFMAKVYSGQVLGKVSMQLKAFCADKVASYIYPKLKSVELKRLPDAPSQFDPALLPAGVLESLHQVAVLAEPSKDEPQHN